MNETLKALASAFYGTLTDCGEWDAATSYNYMLNQLQSVVTYNSIKYVTIGIPTVGVTPDKDTNWEVFAVTAGGGGGASKVKVTSSTITETKPSEIAGDTITLFIEAPSTPGSVNPVLKYDVTSIRGANVTVNSINVGSFSNIGAAIIKPAAQFSITYDDAPIAAGKSVDLICKAKIVNIAAAARTITIPYTLNGIMNDGTVTKIDSGTIANLTIQPSQAVTVTLFDVVNYSVPTTFDFLSIFVDNIVGLTAGDIAFIGNVSTQVIVH